MFRYSDLSSLHPATPDFIRRKRNGSLLKSFAIYFVILVSLVSYAFIKNYHNHDIVLVILLTVAVSTLILHALYSIQKSLDLIMAVEFQNALFTSALNLRVDFTLILQRNGSIVYVDRGFREIFPEVRTIDDKVLDYLTENMRMDSRTKDRFFNAMRNYDYEQIMVEFAREEGQFEKYMLYMSPLPRPQGFFMIQARRFVEVRNAGDAKPGPMPLNLSARTMIESFPSAAYMLDEEGRILQCNSELAKLLGYKNPRECLADMTDLSSLTTRPEALLIDYKPQAYDGSIDLTQRDGTPLRVSLRQNPLMAGEKIIGALGLVQHAS